MANYIQLYTNITVTLLFMYSNIPSCVAKHKIVIFSNDCF